MAGSDSPGLEFVLLELEMLQYLPLQQSFSDYVSQVVDDLGGQLLFNTRLDDDAYQRCIGAILAPGEVDETTALIFLKKDGRSVHVEEARHCSHPISKVALQTPSGIGLHWPNGTT